MQQEVIDTKPNEQEVDIKKENEKQNSPNRSTFICRECVSEGTRIWKKTGAKKEKKIQLLLLI